MAYQGTTYDPARLLPFIEDARRRRMSEQSEREMLKWQKEMQKEQLEMAKREQRMKEKAMNLEMDKEKQRLRAINEYREAERQNSAGNPMGKLNENIAQKNYISMLQGTWGQGGGGGGGISFQPEAPRDEMSATEKQSLAVAAANKPGPSKDAMFGKQMWELQLAEGAADEEAARQMALQSGMTQQKTATEMIKADSRERAAQQTAESKAAEDTEKQKRKYDADVKKKAEEHLMEETMDVLSQLAQNPKFSEKYGKPITASKLLELVRDEERLREIRRDYLAIQKKPEKR